MIDQHFQGRSALNEHEAKRFLAERGIPVNGEVWATDAGAAVQAARTLGYPVVLKAVGEALQHKTEQGAVSLNLRGAEAVSAEAERLLGISGCEGLLVGEMVSGQRELVCGFTRDVQFGPCVMFGLGGVFTELIQDVVFRLAPLRLSEAVAMLADIRYAKVLQAFRGEAPADRAALARILVTLGDIAVAHPEIKEIDLNPVKLRRDGTPVAVDALLAFSPPAPAAPAEVRS